MAFCVTVKTCKQSYREVHGGILQLVSDCDAGPTEPNNEKSVTNILTNEVEKEGVNQNKFQKEPTMNHNKISLLKSKNLYLERIYPNPFNERIALEIESKRKGEIDVRMIDLLGKKILI